MYLDKIKGVTDLRKLKSDNLPVLCSELRDMIIKVVSENGGHIASSLGVVELTVALHYVFNTPDDRLIWDVGHQSYAHKILTGRKDRFSTIRTYKGLSGFPKICESEFDSYDTGHSSTSLSLAAGEAAARDIARRHYKIISVIGDGSLTGGMAFEALNHIGHLNKDLIIILNDNEHSISKNVGGMSAYLTRIIAGHAYNRFVKKLIHFLKKIPFLGKGIFTLFIKLRFSVKTLLLPGHLFEDLGIRYFGPIDGHNIDSLIDIFTRLKSLPKGPKIIHVITKKGKGYKFAEKYPEKFHGIGPFDIKTGLELAKKSVSFSDVAGRTLVELASANNDVVAVTAAMTSGTGLSEFAKKFPNRFFDVAIAEGHGVTFCAAMAKNGMKPFFAVYSSFLQRGFDQLIHDVAVMNLPAVFLIDRSGVVGDDGETHHGLFDVSYIRNIPNFILLSPSNGEELCDMINHAYSLTGPVVIRYPRGSAKSNIIDYSRKKKINPYRVAVSGTGKDVAIITYGDIYNNALEAVKILFAQKIKARIVKLNSLKPLDIAGMEKNIKECRHFITAENAYISGGLAEKIIFEIKPSLRGRHLLSLGFPDSFICHGKQELLLADADLTGETMAVRIKNALK